MRPTVCDALVGAAERCRERCGDRAWLPGEVARLADLVAVVDEPFCRDVADRFERLPRLTYDDAIAHRYDLLKYETRLQYKEIIGAGIAIQPWLRPGQPRRCPSG